MEWNGIRTRRMSVFLIYWREHDLFFGLERIWVTIYDAQSFLYNIVLFVSAWLAM